MYPGPLDKQILTDQDNHISKVIWEGQEIGPLKCIPADPLNEFWELNESQEEVVHMVGLHNVASIAKMKIHHGIIWALVERWRPDTNTFHFNFGKATITLEDVAYIYGLPIDGRLVTGRTISRVEEMRALCYELLGTVPNQTLDCMGAQIKYTWFRLHFDRCPEGASEEIVQRYTHAYLFCLVAQQICSNTSGSRGNGYLLELFRTFERYAWGAACLANLYRTLGKATRLKDGTRTLAGPLQLLQIWALSRMKIGRPIERDWDRIEFAFPLCLMWHERLKGFNLLSNTSSVREQLDKQEDKDNPYIQYGDRLLEHVEDEEMALFGSQTVLIYFGVFENHNVCRVMKQFGLRGITRLRIGRGTANMDAPRNVVEDQLVVKNVLLHLLGQLMKTRILAKVLRSVHSKLCKFHASCATSFDKLDIEECLKDETNEAQQGQGTCGPIVAPTVAPTSSAGLPQDTETSSYVEPLLESSPTQLQVQTPTSVENVLLESASQVHFQTPTSIEALFRSSPSQVHVQTPTSVEDVFQSSPSHSNLTQTGAHVSTPTIMPEQHVVSSIKKRDINSIVARVKGLGRKNRAIPIKFDPYQLTRKRSRLEPNPDYALTDRDRAIMNLFWDHYTAKRSWMDTWCQPVKPKDLRGILSPNWMDTHMMDEWFKNVREKATDSHFFPSNLADLYIHRAEHLYYTAFGVEPFLSRRFSQIRTMIFPIVRNGHFFLIVGFVDRGRFEYYNSIMGRDGDRQLAEEFTIFLKSCFMGLGWDDPSSWPLEDAENCPQQENINDCGIFVMAFAEHAALRRKVALTQADIWYYRQRIVIDIYARQWEMTDVVEDENALETNAVTEERG
ncbi:serine/threonine-protein phosphatase 7 long form [Cinnamomum micranthum f. kanehirae]|uniref:Serine/threonine-protein phosphatase 7 long form n=1 Tax=Cinnamomum micranthum f. kanehirae TaxID=337451 RepID=A0A3S3M3W4_9MAGN|nr:serine/threonine-protein phosphatase 7 long form [Cinnamomum micranthum f. kanehirae]